MNILYLADPNLIHDVRWIHMIKAKGNVCYLLPRERHYQRFMKNETKLPGDIHLLRPIKDPSTVIPMRDLLQALRIRQIVKKKNIELIHIMYAEPNALWANWSFVFNVPMILTTLGTDILLTIPAFFRNDNWLSKLVAYQYRRALNRFNTITCTSRLQRQKLIALNVNVPIRTIRTGVDMDLIRNSNIDVAALIRLNKPFILMPRSMKPIYNHEFTLDAIRLLDRRFLQKFCFVFVDSNTNDQHYFKTITQKAETIQADIRFFPSFNHVEIISFSKQAEIVVMNPVSDGSPVSAMEALACSTPVILPPLQYDMDIFSECFFFEEWTPDSLKNKMEEVLMFDKNLLKERLWKGSRVIDVHGDSVEEIGKVEEIYLRIQLNGV